MHFVKIDLVLTHTFDEYIFVKSQMQLLENFVPIVIKQSKGVCITRLCGFAMC